MGLVTGGEPTAPLTALASEPDKVGAVAAAAAYAGTTYASAVGGIATSQANVSGVLKIGPGRICVVNVTTSGTAATNFYDNALGTATGTIVATLPASPALGAYVYMMPFFNGLSCPAQTNGSAVTIGFV
jgi:hypothetical protein